MSDCESLGNCADSRIERLYEYLDGALSHQDLVDIKDHLDDCPQCAEEHDLECVIRSVVKRSCTEVAPSTLKTSILDRISQLKTADH
ncbi:anti-sigma factor [Arthrobacter sp. RIT-PI-e]|uniref:mycothiol system anti-sigma-R factor n=1 Tax=Arthrobacter sp. RIT-PI-e TaxID=1681197 RepID=UPI0006766715|nr:mycothiol system anti-sigma-R factor [Arthrobacter sp. RIT-PI-e]KNC19585.1 anti-sigma factor [Arthrobacter sp. RIT-PI-e]